MFPGGSILSTRDIIIRKIWGANRVAPFTRRGRCSSHESTSNHLAPPRYVEWRYSPFFFVFAWFGCGRLRPVSCSKVKPHEKKPKMEAAGRKPRDEWRAGDDLEKALEPSTSKEFVLPRFELAIFENHRFFTEAGEITERNVVLENFYELEKFAQPSAKYFECVQSEITLEMRQILVEWMLQVCNEERCSCEVFPLAVSYLDRFLSIESVHKKQLQALGVTCIFLASKVKEPRPFAAMRLVQYTDHGVSMSELLAWEFLILNRLDWDLASLTAFDFIDQYMHLLRFRVYEKGILREQLNFLVAQIAVDFRLTVLPPSTIAAICLNLASMQVLGAYHDASQKIAMAVEKLIDSLTDPMKKAVNELETRYSVFAVAQCQKVYAKSFVVSVPVLAEL